MSARREVRSSDVVDEITRAVAIPCAFKFHAEWRIELVTHRACHNRRVVCVELSVYAGTNDLGAVQMVPAGAKTDIPTVRGKRGGNK